MPKIKLKLTLTHILIWLRINAENRNLHGIPNQHDCLNINGWKDVQNNGRNLFELGKNMVAAIHYSALHGYILVINYKALIKI